MMSFSKIVISSKSAATRMELRDDAFAGTMLAAAPPEIVPILNVVFPNVEVDGQSTSSSELRHLIRISIADTPSSG